MEPYSMLQTAAALFCFAAAGGLVMAGMRFSGYLQPPTWLAMVHGLFAAGALTLLAYAALFVGVPPMAQYALGLFVLAALGGAAMNLLFHWKRLPLPIPMMIVHALVAVAGLALLLMSIFGQPDI